MDNVVHVDFGKGVELLNVVIPTKPNLDGFAAAFTYEHSIKTVRVHLLAFDGEKFVEATVLQEYKVTSREIAESIAEDVPTMSALELMIMHKELKRQAQK